MKVFTQARVRSMAAGATAALVIAVLPGAGMAAASGFTETDQLIASDASPYDSLGYSVAISGDRIVVGAPAVLAVYVFEPDSTGDYAETTTLTADDAAGFGTSVAIEGDRVVVGAPSEGDAGTPNSGSAYVFDPDGNGDFVQTAKLTATHPAANDRFGTSVAVSGDRIVAGAPDNDGGSAYVFARESNGDYLQTDRLMATVAADGDSLGWSVAISGDRIVTGAHNADHGSSNSGAAHVFEPDSNGDFVQSATLTAEDADEFDQFGFSVAIDGERILVGAPRNDDTASNSGSVYAFAPVTNGGYGQTDKLVATDAADNDRFGTSVAVSSDRIVAGAALDDNENGNGAGSAYVFEPDTSGTFTQTDKLLANEFAPAERFGQSVATSGDRIVAGAPIPKAEFDGPGAAHVFQTFAPEFDPSCTVIGTAATTR